MPSSTIEKILGNLETDLHNKYVSAENEIDISVSSGHAGLALFYTYYYKLTGNEEHRQKAEDCIARVLDYISDHDPAYTWCTGIAGAAWVYQHMMDHGILEKDDAALDDFDEYLTLMGLADLESGRYDYFHAGLGAGMYLLERKNGRELLERLVDPLQRSSRSDASGTYWIDTLTPLYTPSKISSVNFGMAHGVPSIIFFLTQLVNRKLGGDGIVTMLNETIRYIMKESELDNYTGCYFPSSVPLEGPRGPKKMSRLGWCYGDLGAIAALSQAAIATHDDRLLGELHGFAVRTIGRKSKEQTQILDGSLCHGHAGVAMVNRQFAAYFKDPQFLDAAAYWDAQLLEFIDQGGGIQEFKYYDARQEKYIGATSLLNGSLGAGLVLITSLRPDIKPEWDRFFLLR